MAAKRPEKNKLKGVMALAGAACHELNQPMQVIMGYAELFGKGLPAEDPLADALTEISTQISRMPCGLVMRAGVRQKL